MVAWMKWPLRLVLFALPVVAGLFSISYFQSVKAEAAVKSNKPQPTPVRVLPVKPLAIVPRAVGYGTVAPARELRAIARIDGEVVWTAPELANGTSVAKGAQLLRLDDTGIKLSLAQIDAQIAAIAVKNQTVAINLDIAKQDLALAEADLQRQKDLTTQGVLSKAALDQAQRQLLSARSSVSGLENQIVLNEAERKVLVAQRAISARDMQFATIAAPYALRIDEVNAQIGQYVAKGQTLFSAEGTDKVEVSAQFPIGILGPLVRQAGGSGATQPVLDLKAKVILDAPGHEVSWDARVDRVAEAIDTRTQSTTVVVAIDQPNAVAQAGSRPQLRRGMFVTVELSAPESKAIAVPARAISDGSVLLVDADGKIAERQVTIAYQTGSLSVISKGLEKGDKLVLADPTLLMPGMTVKPVEDKKTAKAVAAEAAGTDMAQ